MHKIHVCSGNLQWHLHIIQIHLKITHVLSPGNWFYCTIWGMKWAPGNPCSCEAYIHPMISVPGNPCSVENAVTTVTFGPGNPCSMDNTVTTVTFGPGNPRYVENKLINETVGPGNPFSVENTVTPMLVFGSFVHWLYRFALRVLEVSTGCCLNTEQASEAWRWTCSWQQRECHTYSAHSFWGELYRWIQNTCTLKHPERLRHIVSFRVVWCYSSAILCQTPHPGIKSNSLIFKAKRFKVIWHGKVVVRTLDCLSLHTLSHKPGHAH